MSEQAEFPFDDQNDQNDTFHAPTVTTNIDLLDSALPAIVGDLGPVKTFYPAISVLQPGSTPVASGEKRPGTFLLKGRKNEDPIDLGSQFDAIPLTFRTKAVDFSTPGQVTTAYDVASAEFQDIQSRANRPGKTPETWGPEWLLFLPDHNLYAVLFCNTISLQNFARLGLQPFAIPKRTACTITASKAPDTTKGVFYVCNAKKATAPLTHPIDVNEAIKHVSDFNNHPPLDVWVKGGKDEEKDDRPQ